VHRVFLLLLLLVLVVFPAFPQDETFLYKRENYSTSIGFERATRQTRYLSAAFGINIHAYAGDLTPNERYISNGLKAIRPGIGAAVSYNFSPRVFFSGEMSYGRIVGDDFNADPYGKSSRKYVRNLSFRNDLIGLTLRANANVLRDPFEFYKRKDFNAYFFTGIALFYSNPKARVPATDRAGEVFENSGEWVALRPLGTEGQNHPDYGKKYGALQVGLPLGSGLRFRLGYRTDLQVEGTIFYILSDYIDDIGNSFVDLGVFDNELARSLSDRSMEAVAVVSGEMRNKQAILDLTTEYTYESAYDGNTYTVFANMGEDGGLRGGRRNDFVGTLSIKICYIFTH
jgi:hypothetical protein